MRISIRPAKAFDDSEYRKHRDGSFGSIHALLNHILLGDRIWMDRFEGGGRETPLLNTVLAPDFASLRRARMEEDARSRIEQFFTPAQPTLFSATLAYGNNQGKTLS